MKKNDRRPVDTVVISDVHLGTYGCHANELVQYLRSIRPKRILLNGDIIDIWQFSKSYFPASHMKVVKELMRHLSKGVEVYYIPGNHDETLRKFVGQRIGNLIIDNKVVLEMDGKRTWVFHGDVFDTVTSHFKWIARLGDVGYTFLLWVNRQYNYRRLKKGLPYYSLSQKIKSKVKQAVKYIDDYEKQLSEMAKFKECDGIICGHIHQPANKMIEDIHYLNSGDWVESMTALVEDLNGDWRLVYYTDSQQSVIKTTAKKEPEEITISLEDYLAKNITDRPAFLG